MKDVDYDEDEMAEAVCDEIFGVARGVTLVSEIKDNTKWPSRLREHFQNGIEYIGKFYNYVDDDLTGRLDLEEVRTGTFLLFQGLNTLPGFTLANLPEKHDMGGEQTLPDHFAYRRVLQQLIIDIVVHNLPAILNEVQEIKDVKGALLNTQMANYHEKEYKRTKEKPEDLELIDWTIDYIAYCIFHTIEEKEEEEVKKTFRGQKAS
eukprot:TRINITY_DN980_c1_g1_i1.p1 TRINITY_DN980_c1_g1~~TRINITY_DN980_c1_g1_i1.p1  ORF type:complete len:206 (-),score=34.15 TRINITY_DN980_c1_g1_i1:50-667(-)